MKTKEQIAAEVIASICSDLSQHSKAQAGDQRWYRAYLAWALDGQAIKPVQE